MFMCKLKIKPSGFLNTVVYLNTLIAPKPSVCLFVCVCVLMSAARHVADTVLQSLCGQGTAPTWSTGSH